MQTTERKQLFKRQPKLIGGIRQDKSTWDPEGGWWTLNGLHGNDTDALTKWSGSQIWLTPTLDARIVGLFQTVLAGVRHYFIMAHGNVYRSANGASVDLLDSGYDLSAFFDGETIGGMFFFVNGVQTNHKITSTLDVQVVGIVAPFSPPGVAQGAGGTLSGTFQYEYTYKNSVSGAESNPSPPSAVITVASHYVNLTLVQSADAQVDRIVIYRTTDGGGVFLKVAEVPGNNTTYTDTKDDDDLGIEASVFRDVPPISKYIELYNGMMLYAGLAFPFQNRVMPSEVLLPEAVSQFNTYDLDPEDNDVITGMKKYGQAIAVYKNNALFLGSGLAPDAITFVRTRVVEGSVGNACIIALKSSHAYLSQKGPHAFSGLQEEYIGRPIEGIYRTFSQRALQDSSGVYYKPLNMLIWNVQTIGSPEYDTWLIYHMITKEWSTRTYASSKLATYLDDNNLTKLWIGTEAGRVLTGDIGFSDNGQPIAMDAISRGICLKYRGKGEPDLDQLYCFRHVEVYYDDSAGGEDITVSVAVDNPNNPFTVIGSFTPANGTRTRFNIPIGASYGRILFVRFTGSTTENLKIRGYRVEGLPLGRF